jgi:hypothetical protein
LEISVDGAHHREASYIELSALVEQWLFNVFLNDVGPFVAVYVGVLNQAFDVV